MSCLHYNINIQCRAEHIEMSPSHQHVPIKTAEGHSHNGTQTQRGRNNVLFWTWPTVHGVSTRMRFLVCRSDSWLFHVMLFDYDYRADAGNNSSWWHTVLATYKYLSSVIILFAYLHSSPQWLYCFIPARTIYFDKFSDHANLFF